MVGVVALKEKNLLQNQLPLLEQEDVVVEWLAW